MAPRQRMGSVCRPQRTGLKWRRAAAVAAFLWAGLAQAATVGDLRCEYLVDPQGIDDASPRLGWTIESDRRGEAQTAYQVMVASSPQMLDRGVGDLWDSGKVASADSIQVTYQGQPLGSLRACYWKVCVWDRRGNASRGSKPARGAVGVLQPAGWGGKRVGLGPPAGQRIAVEQARTVDDGAAPARGLGRKMDRTGPGEGLRSRRLAPPARAVAAKGVFRGKGRQPGDRVLFRTGLVRALPQREQDRRRGAVPRPERLPQAGVLCDPRRHVGPEAGGERHRSRARKRAVLRAAPDEPENRDVRRAHAPSSAAPRIRGRGRRGRGQRRDLEDQRRRADRRQQRV